MKSIAQNNFSFGCLLSNYRLLVLVLIFAAFLTPISLLVRGDNVSINYSFILFPFFLLLAGGKIKIPDKKVQTLIGIYTALFIICLIYQHYYIEFWERRLISFALFMSMFTFFFIKIDEQMVKSFKYSIILISFIYSINSIYTYFYNGGSALGYDIMRPIVQSQRYGFILLFGFWLTVLHKTRSIIGFLIKLIIVAVIFNGLGLTFSRSSVAGILVSTFILFLILILKLINQLSRKPKTLQIKKIIFSTIFYSALATALIYTSYFLIPDYFQFFSERLLKLNITPLREGYFSLSKYPNYDTYVYNQLESSEGYRIFMITEIFKYLTSNPLFGSGFLGVWIMFDDLSGASHNQFLDILFRTGLIGFSCFLFILYKLFKYTIASQDLAVLISLAGILAIGLFHETFKLSQGAFIFSFLSAHGFNYIYNK